MDQICCFNRLRLGEFFKAKAILCHVLQTMPGQFLQCGRVHYPVMSTWIPRHKVYQQNIDHNTASANPSKWCTHEPDLKENIIHQTRQFSFIAPLSSSDDYMPIVGIFSGGQGSLWAFWLVCSYSFLDCNSTVSVIHWLLCFLLTLVSVTLLFYAFT